MHKLLLILKLNIVLICLSMLLPACNFIPKKKHFKKYTVEIKEMKFQPAELVLQKGDTVVWINNDVVVHDVTEEKSKAWTSNLISIGNSWTFVPTQSVDYYCSIHVTMKGKIIVE